MATLWPVGVAIYIIGTVGEALGANLQRYSFRMEEAKAESERENPWQQTPWVAGFFLFVFSGIGMSVSLFFASQTQLAPLQLCLFVNNALFAHFLNREPFYCRTDGLATAMVMAGVLMCVITAPKHSEDYDDDGMLNLFKQWSFIVFVSLTVSAIIAIYLTRRWIWKQAEWDSSKIDKPWKLTVLNLSFGALAGAIGGLNVTLTKTTFSLIVGEYKDGGILEMLSSPVLWAVSMILVGTYILQMKCNVDGLAECSAMIVISTHCVSEEVVVTLGGILYFQDYKQFDIVSAIVFSVGNILAVIAVIALGHFRSEVEMAERSKKSDSTALPVDEDGHLFDTVGLQFKHVNPLAMSDACASPQALQEHEKPVKSVSPALEAKEGTTSGQELANLDQEGQVQIESMQMDQFSINPDVLSEDLVVLESSVIANEAGDEACAEASAVSEESQDDDSCRRHLHLDV